MTIFTRQERRQKRHLRVRRKLWGTPECPRLCIYKSRRHLYVQVIDDVSEHKGSRAMLQLTTNSKSFKGDGKKQVFRNIESAKKLGAHLGELMKEKGILEVGFDRSGYKYHGLVKAFADAVREKGIKF